MVQRVRLVVFAAVLALVSLTALESARGQGEIKGQRVFYTGHIFHYFVPPILADIARKAEVKEHTQVGLSAIGGSRVYQHWNVAEEKNKAKQSLKDGKLDVFTMSPIYLPDDGIENFVKLGIANNPKIRIFVQENWLPWDHYDVNFKRPAGKIDHNAPTAESLKKLHEPYFKSIDDHVIGLNKKHETKAIRVAPVGQAVIALRVKIIDGSAPGLKVQNDLFTDEIGHAKAPLAALAAYVYYALIYERSPAGLPVPQVLAKAPEAEKLNRLLQVIAWQAVTEHPLSGVKANK